MSYLAQLEVRVFTLLLSYIMIVLCLLLVCILTQLIHLHLLSTP
jgi:hypothetical protein